MLLFDFPLLVCLLFLISILLLAFNLEFPFVYLGGALLVFVNVTLLFFLKKMLRGSLNFRSQEG